MSRPARLDRLCAEAVELARSAAEETGEGVGEYLHAEAEADRVVTHFFDSTLAGYRGWRWAVVVARAPRSRTVTVNETALLPGPDALKAPEWVPWAERLQAGDVGVGDLLPTDESDARLMPAYAYSDDDAVEDIAFELGVGRTRVMSREGRSDCAERWYEGEHGPSAEIATSAPPEARCGSCGFYLPLAGSLRQLFGVCGNMYASDDASVVSSDHGCGAHSEVLTEVDTSGPGNVEHTDTAYDDALIEQIDTSAADEDEAATAATDADAEAADTPGTEADSGEPEADVEVPETVEAVAEPAVDEPQAETTVTEPAEVPEAAEPAAEVAVVEPRVEPAAEEPQAGVAVTESADSVADEPVAEVAVVESVAARPEPQAEAAVTESSEPEVAVSVTESSEPQAVTVEVEPEGDTAEASVEVDVTVPSEAAEVTVVAQPPAEADPVEPPAETAADAAVDHDTPDTETIVPGAAPSPTTEDSAGSEPGQVSPAADASDSDREAP